MRKKLQMIVLVLFCAIGVFATSFAFAQVRDFTVSEYDDYMNYTVGVGDTGRIIPNYTAEGITWSFVSGDSSIVTINETTGEYQAIACGSTYIMVSGQSADEYSDGFYAKYYITVIPDMTNVTLGKSKVKGYVVGYDSCYIDIPVKSDVILNSDNCSLSVSSSNDEVYANVDINNNILTISASGVGKTTLKIIMNEKEYKVTLTMIRIQMNKDSVVLAKGKTVGLKVKGTSDKPKWSSSNKKIAKVTSKGVVKAKKYGNVVITAEFGGKRVGCAVSVVKGKVVNVIKRAKMIGSKWTYSQPKRMQKGFYDCSSLVWKSWSLAGKKFGMSNYAPVAADLAKYCKEHGTVITKAYTRKHIDDMVLQPGDLMFETGAKNGRYKGIYHVEMFVGYTVVGYDGEKPQLLEKWAARPDGYYGGGHLIERP